MRSTFDFEQVVTMVRSYLEENQGSKFNIGQLSAAISLKTGIKNKVRIKTTINALVASGVVGGYFIKGQARSIAYRDSTQITDECYNRLRDEITRLKSELDTAQSEVQAAAQIAVEQVDKARQEAKKQLEQAQSAVYEIHVTNGNGKVVRKVTAQTYHPIFKEVVELAMARQHIFIPGPAGCGKSHLAGQVAAVLKLEYSFISCSVGMSESMLLGRMVPAGKNGQMIFQTTEFLERYEKGGVFLFDEIDAADANVLLVVNAALANGHLAVPSRLGSPVAKRHPDFICIAAANTFGTGADRQYVGRNQLDESTLDRFRIGTVPMDYSETLERSLVAEQLPNSDGERLYERMLRYRANIRKHRLPRILSTRFILQAAMMMRSQNGTPGWNDDRVDAKLFAGWRPDEITKTRATY